MQIVGAFACHSIFRRGTRRTNHSYMRMRVQPSWPGLDQTLKSRGSFQRPISFRILPRSSRRASLVTAADRFAKSRAPLSETSPCRRRRRKSDLQYSSFRCVTFYAAPRNLCRPTGVFLLFILFFPPDSFAVSVFNRAVYLLPVRRVCSLQITACKV